MNCARSRLRRACSLRPMGRPTWKWATPRSLLPSTARASAECGHKRSTTAPSSTSSSRRPPFRASSAGKHASLTGKKWGARLRTGDTFEAVVDTSIYPRSQIDIYLQIMQADGGQVQACINAATLALINAGVAMRDYVVACTVGNVDGTPLLDLNHIEVSQGTPEITLAMLPRSGNVVLIQLESRLHMDKLEKTLQLAKDGCAQIHELLDEVVRKELRDLVHKVGQHSSTVRGVSTT
ncbi:hypothetical protein AMAG_08811 [Allomyces macrogynus ATCC 38327]|uniref:Uncharacterized protein n=1 Tax=Allomyces macrogynus (strain ATCC 38327) TaxID=578462 RepID=A0A0L0SMX5_ALLM3|nr:hypothetical protein AMAG_08811 [Allomyces macrogynus ATCC 38327]|eukprot:KNE63724.1 hypothetical protein AMAG_08811 [Allomyces macrogynus ATCC 38327]